MPTSPTGRCRAHPRPSRSWTSYPPAGAAPRPRCAGRRRARGLDGRPGAKRDGSFARGPGQTLIGDKNYFGRDFERELAEQAVQLLRPARKGERERPGAHLFKPLRQVIESINETFKGQLDLEQHGGRTPSGVIARVMQRILALTAAIWHNDRTGQPVLRSLTAYDH